MRPKSDYHYCGPGVAFTCAIFQRMMTFCAVGFGSDCVDCLLCSRCAAIACDCISHGSTGYCGKVVVEVAYCM